MRHHIIHILLTMIGMAGVTSCASDPDLDVRDTGHGEEMIFEVSSAASRSSITYDNDLTAKPFMLFGDVNRKAEFGSHTGLRTLFNGEKVTYKDNRWNTETKQYWEMGQEHSFIAVHPYDTPGLDIKGYSDSTLTFKISLPEDLNSVTDLLVATHRRKYTMDNSSAVRFKFSHILARVLVAPALHDGLLYANDSTLRNDTINDYNVKYYKDEYIVIRGFEIRAYKATGTLQVTPSRLAGSTATDNCELGYVVNTSDVLATKRYDFDKDGKEGIKITNNNKNVYVIDEDEYPVIMIPQTFMTDDAEMVLEYTINDDIHRKRIVIPLKGVTWEMGKIYTYRFTIEKAYTGQIEPGTFVVDVDDPRLPAEGEDAWMWDGKTINFEF